jgi:hypothetical protein
MADPISLLAVAGLVYAGRNLSKSPKSEAPQAKAETEIVPEPEINVEFKENDFLTRTGIPHKREMDSFADISMQQRTGGQEILNMRNRMYDQGRMNNLSPVEKQLVGPGLGVDANVPATGGYRSCRSSRGYHWWTLGGRWSADPQQTRDHRSPSKPFTHDARTCPRYVGCRSKKRT